MSKKFIASLFLVMLLLPSSAAAVKCDFSTLGLKSSFKCVKELQASSGIKDAQPIDLVISFLKVALTLAAIIAVVAIVVAGFMYVTAGSDESKAEKGKKALLYAILGLIVIGISVGIVNLVVRTLKEQPAAPAAGGGAGAGAPADPGVGIGAPLPRP